MSFGPWNQPQPPPQDREGAVEVLSLESEMRLRVYLELGFPLEDAENLAVRDDVDWHLAKRLVDDGCDIDTALRIVS